MSDAHGNPVTAASREAVALLDATVSAYLGFRQDTGDRLKAVFGGRSRSRDGALPARLFHDAVRPAGNGAARPAVAGGGQDGGAGGRRHAARGGAYRGARGLGRRRFRRRNGRTGKTISRNIRATYWRSSWPNTAVSMPVRASGCTTSSPAPCRHGMPRCPITALYSAVMRSASRKPAITRPPNAPAVKLSSATPPTSGPRTRCSTCSR